MDSASFPTVKVEGSLLPPDMLARLASGNAELPGMDAESYHLSGERIREASARSWNRLTGAWVAFQDARKQQPEDAPTTALTRNRWLNILFQELGFGQLEVNRLALEVGGGEFAISHMWRNVPIHLVGCGFELERRYPGEVGMARLSAFGTLQQFLNRSDEHLWGIVSNGLRLRLLRDTVSLSRHAYIEFDLEAMMDGDVYPDFVLLWVLLHESRFEDEAGEGILLERWFERASEEGTRALDRLRDSVEHALRALGRGFLRHPDNHALLQRLRSGDLDADGYYRQLLRLVYRLIFLFVAEDRGVLLDPQAPDELRARYHRLYGNARIRKMAGEVRGGRHDDLFRMMGLVMVWVSRDEGQPALGLYPLNSVLFSPDAIPDLIDARIHNREFLNAVRHLSYVRDGHARRAVNFRLLGSREFGSVYESLLELHPGLDLRMPDFTLDVRPGHERKSTGSYYTPEPLIQSLLDSALDPVIERALASDKPAEALLDLKIVDPAAGGGHFLVSAAHRIADALAVVRSETEEPPTEERRRALRDVIGQCLYGVDLNPMAAELCKVGLWLEGVEPGRPLSFLEHRIVSGNSLFGVTADLIADDLPAGAFEPTEGDDPVFARRLRDRSERESSASQPDMFSGGVPWEASAKHVREGIERVDAIDDATVTGIHRRQEAWQKLQKSEDYVASKTVADAWTAAFVLPKRSDVPIQLTQGTLNQIRNHPLSAPAEIKTEVEAVATIYRFLHWHVTFPDVMLPGSDGNESASGFDVVLGNPPWDQLEVKDDMDPGEQRRTRALQHFVGHSGVYPLTSSGRKNVYALFVELALRLVRPLGRVGLVVPTGVVTDEPSAKLAEAMVRSERLVSLYDFENRGRFPDVDDRQRICLLTLTGKAATSPQPTFAFLIDDLDAADQSESTWSSTYDDLKALSPARFAIPTFSSSSAAGIGLRVYRHGVTLADLAKTDDEIPSTLLYNGGEKSKALRVEIESEPPGKGTWVRVYEGSYFHSYDHRFATTIQGKAAAVAAEKKEDTNWWPWTKYVMPPEGLDRWNYLRGSVPDWYLLLRRQARVTDAKTTIAAIVPRSVAEGSASAFWFEEGRAGVAALLCATFNSFVFDYLVRNRQSGANLSKGVYIQIPLPKLIFTSGADHHEERRFIAERVLRLTYTSRHLEAFAKALGHDRPPFRWDEEERCRLRAEVEAAVFLAYGLGREQAEHIFGTFSVLARQEVEEFGAFRTRDAVLAALDRQEAFLSLT